MHPKKLVLAATLALAVLAADSSSARSANTQALEHHKLALAITLPHYRRLLHRGDVVSGREIEADPVKMLTGAGTYRTHKLPIIAAVMIATTRKAAALIAKPSRRSIWVRIGSLRGIVRMAASCEDCAPKYQISQRSSPTSRSRDSSSRARASSSPDTPLPGHRCNGSARKCHEMARAAQLHEATHLCLHFEAQRKRLIKFQM